MLLKSAFFYVFHNSSPHCSDVVIPVLEGRYLRILSIFCRGREEVIYFYKLITSCGGHRSKWGQQPGALLYGALGSDALALMMQSNTRFGVGSVVGSVARCRAHYVCALYLDPLASFFHRCLLCHDSPNNACLAERERAKQSPRTTPSSDYSDLSEQSLLVMSHPWGNPDFITYQSKYIAWKRSCQVWNAIFLTERRKSVRCQRQ